jgi:Tfp pilus assembly protein FimV
MGNIGGIEKIMVFGILVIILIILGIAFYSATKVENDLTSNQMKAAGNDEVITLLDPPSVVENDPPVESKVEKPLFKDVFNPNGPSNPPAALKSNDHVNESPVQPNDPVPAGDEVVEPQVKKPEVKIYEVKPGDSFMKIARAMYGDDKKYTLLMEANPNIDPHNLQVGQKLRIPPIDGAAKPAAENTVTEAVPEGAKTYVVQSGDTLVDISIAMYGTGSRWMKIYEANRGVIANPDVLRVGTKLVIP